jgi:hypothetical protein
MTTVNMSVIVRKTQGEIVTGVPWQKRIGLARESRFNAELGPAELANRLFFFERAD